MAGRVGRAQRGLDRVDHQAPRGREVPRRQRPHRRGGQEQPRRLPRPVPDAVAAAVRLRVRADPERRRHRSADRAGHDEAAVGLVRRPALRQRALRHDGPGPARRHPVVRREPHRHRPVQVRRLGAEPEVRGREEPGLLGHRRGGQPAPVPRRHRVPAHRRGRPAAERPPVGRDQRHAHERRRDDRRPAIPGRVGRDQRVRVGGVRRGQLHHAERGQAAVRQHQGPPGSGLRVRLRRGQRHHQRRDHHPGDGPVRAGQHRQPRRHGVPDLRPRRGRAAGRGVRAARPARTCRSRTPRPMRRPPSSWASWSRSRPRPSA